MSKKFISTVLSLFALLTVSEAKEKPTPDRKILYKKVGETELKLHLFTPPASQAGEARTAAIFFFGGGWKTGSPSQFYPHCAHLASRGVVAISAEYRIESKHGTTPIECVKDGKSAIRWVRSHATELGIDPKKIIVGGGSAGGHVAAAAAVTQRFNEEGEDTSISTVPVALALFNPVFDNGPDGYGYERVKDYWQDISPMHNLGERTPPTIVFLGTKDHHIPVKTAEDYKSQMEEKGRRCDLHLYKGQGHGFFNYRNRKQYDSTIEKMDQFLTSLGLLKE